MENDEIIMIICLIIVPFIGVFLKEEKQITMNFWICLILCFFGWLPGILYGFYVCYIANKGSA